MPRVRGRSNASLAMSLSLSTSLDMDDPLARALQPPPDESPAERDERIRSEREAKRISDEIDEELRRERTALRRKRPVRVLLLGQSESGKSTTLKNFQIHYAPQAWREERACWRAVIQLNLIRSVSLVLDTVAASPAPSPTAELTSPISDSPLGPPPPAPTTHLDPPPGSIAARYAPLLARLIVAERILQRRLSPNDTDEPGDYRSFAATDTPPSLIPPTLAPRTQEFFVRASGASSWKARFLRRLSASTNGSPSSTPTPTPGRGSSDRDHPLRSSLDFRGRAQSNASHPGKLEFAAMAADDDAPQSPSQILLAALPEMRALWRDRDVRAALERAGGGGGGKNGGGAGRMRVEDMPGFFLNDVDRIAARGYEPSDDDVIRARLRTMGVQEHRFTFERGVDSGREWRVYDVGGARSQVASWLSFFDDMDAIIFLAPISCFDETLAEDRRVNRLEDSITLWRTICRSPLLGRVQLVLFLNKVDLLRRKIANGTRIARHVTSFGDRSNDVETVCKYFKQKFKEIQKQYSPEPRPYYVYFTSVTDTKATGITLGIVREGILRSNLHKADFL